MGDNRLEFHFQECLGKGGFGEVYLATVSRQGGLARQMAVKVLREGLDDQDDAVQRLRDEGRLLGMLNHPALLRATDMCRLQGRIALVMEYVEGMDIAKACRPDRLLPQRAVVQAIGEVADAMHVAWTTLSPETGRPLHLIHRDIKPENMRVTIHGQMKLLDFGIARSTEMSRNAKTKLGELPFTPGYAAPECFRRGEQGPEADVYALGVSMYRLLVGERLYEDMDIGEQFGTASLQSVYEPWVMERLSKVNAEHRKVMALVQRMLAYEKTNRPTAKEVADICEELAAEMEGLTLQKWARGIQFPAPKPLKDAAFSGLVLFEDDPEVPTGKSPGKGGNKRNLPTPPPPVMGLVPPPPPTDAAPAKVTRETAARGSAPDMSPPRLPKVGGPPEFTPSGGQKFKGTLTPSMPPAEAPSLGGPAGRSNPGVSGAKSGPTLGGSRSNPPRNDTPRPSPARSIGSMPIPPRPVPQKGGGMGQMVGIGALVLVLLMGVALILAAVVAIAYMGLS